MHNDGASQIQRLIAGHKYLTRAEREIAIRESLSRGVENYLIAGCLLGQAKKERDWEKDHIAHSFYEWVEKELLISRTQAQRMIDIWVTFQPYLENHLTDILQIEFSKLDAIVPVLRKSGIDAGLEWIHKAATNSVRDLKRNIVEMRGGVPDDMCEHENLEPWDKCLNCNKFIRRA